MVLTTDLDTKARYSRERLAGYVPELMGRAVILILGAGALAQSLLPNLVLPGVGEIRICDFDDFEAHNASRSIYYPTAEEHCNLGTKKARVVASKSLPQMLATHPVMRYAIVPVQQLGLGGFEGVDVVISAVDNPRARAYLSDVCRYLGITLIEGGFDGAAIAMSCFPGVAANEADSRPCYRCGNPHLIGTFSCQRYAAEAGKVGIIAAIQPASATLAGLMAEAAIQSVHGEHPMAFKRTTLNVRTGEYRQYELTRNPKCPGVHARLDETPVDLPITPRDSVGALIEAVEHLLGTGAVIDLAEPFVVEAYCMSCGEVVTVEAPEWSYDMTPRCRKCGGPWTSIGTAGEGYSPLKPIRIDATVERRILELPAAKAGFVAMNLVHAYHPETDTSAIFRIAGDLGELYQTVS